MIYSGEMNMDKDPFKEYLRESEPNKATKGYVWSTAVGLQAVDGLKPSQYLIDTAIQNIEGKITLKEAQSLIESYDNERTEEADKVSSRIAELLSETAFSFSPNEYIAIHRKLFRGIYKHAGKIRDYNITKKEWVLDGATVIYGSASELRATLEYDFSQEQAFSYKGLSIEESIHHLALFVSRLWQIHIFGEGNTRTTAVFFIKYLRTLGFLATNDIFAENAWYFRNALVRANYTNLQKGIHETTEYLDIGTSKVDIGTSKVDIETRLAEKTLNFSTKTIMHIRVLYEKFGDCQFFGRGEVMELLGLKSSGASKIISNMVQADVIEPVSGHGKGKYKFKEL